MDGALNHPSNVLVAGTKSQDTNAAALGSGSCSSVLIQNDHASTVNLLVGDASSQPIKIQPGENITIACGNLALVYCKAASDTVTVNHIARR